MSHSFSRRSFLKYTAAAAVAVAGSTLLTGCENGYSPVSTQIGESLTVLKVKSTLNKASYDSEQHLLQFYVTLLVKRNNSIRIDDSSFVVKTGSHYNRAPKVQFTYLDATAAMEYTTKEGATEPAKNYAAEPNNIKNDEIVTFLVQVPNVDLAADETVRFTFFPQARKYPSYNANWELKDLQQAPAEE